MGLSQALKDMLNKFADTQIALRTPELPLGASNPMLGDALEAAYASAEKVVSGTYDFATHGGTVGTKNLGLALPAGAIVTRLWTDALTPMTSGGLATVAIEVGADVLLAATAFNDAALTDLDQQTAGLPLKSAAGGNLEFVIADEALTAGKVRVMVAYIQP